MISRRRLQSKKRDLAKAIFEPSILFLHLKVEATEAELSSLAFRGQGMS